MDRVLGGKKKNLKCTCGSLRYPRMYLCPKCYYGKMKYYICNITLDEGDSGFYDSDKTLYMLQGIDITNALNRHSEYRFHGDGTHQIAYVAENVREFFTLQEALDYISDKNLIVERKYV